MKMKKPLCATLAVGAVALIAGCGSAGTDTHTTTVIEKVEAPPVETAPPVTEAPTPTNSTEVSALAEEAAELQIAEYPNTCPEFNEGIEYLGRPLAEETFIEGWEPANATEKAEAEEGFQALFNACQEGGV